MKKDFDYKAIEEHIRGILTALGEDPQREGLKETPERVARMYGEIFEGMRYSNAEIARMFGKTFEYSGGTEDFVLVKNITAFSHCEHHMALMYDMNISVAYIPAGKVLGLSKIARIADMVCRRLQLQERIGADIAEIIMLAADCSDAAVIIDGCHGCMTARGIKNSSAVTSTVTLRGRFETDMALQNRLILSVGANRSALRL